MTLIEILRMLLRRIYIVIAATLIAAAIAGLVSHYLLKDVYQATTTIIVSSQKSQNDLNTMTYNDYTLNLKLVNSYQVLTKTNRVLSQVIQQTGVRYSLATLAGMISVQSEKDTEIISISVRDSDPAEAQKIANALADVFQQEVISIMKMDNVQIIDYAPLPTVPVYPKNTQNMLLAGLAGLVLGIGIIFLIERMDYTIKTSEQVEELIDVPVIGCIPHA
jgi:capsular polysaccharide biosynthesis protein